MTAFSSLPQALEDGQDNSQQKFKGVSRILGPRWAHLPTITFALLGVQIFWSVEMSYASPYLLSLGLSKSNMAVVFVAGPLSGLIMQPLIGVLADNCTSRFGRRRPYMLLGTVICVCAMLLFGFTRQVAAVFTEWDSYSNDILTIWLAVLSIYLIDFSINAVQAVDRALLVDTLPPSDQAAGNAWAARMLGIGSVVGFFFGNIDLPRLFPFLGKSQLQVLSVIVSFLLLVGHILMAVLVKEKVLLKTISANGKSNRKSFTNEMKEIWANLRTLPYVIRQICIIQFFAWIAWFPVLFYSTIYVGDLHKKSSPVPTTDDERAELDSEANRLGSRALLYSALLALLVNLIIPLFVAEAAPRPKPGPAATKYSRGTTWWEQIIRVPRGMQVHLATVWAVSHFVFAGCMFATLLLTDGCISFTHSVSGSMFIITITGFSWAITQWAPFSLLAEAILTEPATRSTDDNDTASIMLTDTRTQGRRSTERGDEQSAFLPGNVSDDDDENYGNEERWLIEERRRVLSNSGAQMSRVVLQGGGSGDINFGDYEEEENGYEIVRAEDEGTRMGRSRATARSEGGMLSSKAGVILGIHNIFIVIPQLLVTGVSAILFALFDPQKPALPAHRAPVAPAPVVNSTETDTSGVLLVTAGNATAEMVSKGAGILYSVLIRQEGLGEQGEVQHSNSVVHIFRIGGIAASLAFVLAWRLAREIRHR